MFATQAYILISLILPKLMGSGNNNTPAVLMKAGKLQCSSTSMLGPVADTSQFQHQNAAVRHRLSPEGQSLPKTATSALLICSEGCFRHVAGTFQILLALIALAVASSSLPIQLWYLFYNCCIYKFPLSRCEKQRQLQPSSHCPEGLQMWPLGSLQWRTWSRVAFYPLLQRTEITTQTNRRKVGVGTKY